VRALSRTIKMMYSDGIDFEYRWLWWILKLTEGYSLRSLI